MIEVDSALLHEIAPRVGGKKGQCQSQIIEEVGGVATTTLDRYAINTRLRIAHFLAQACHESDGFCTTVEYASGEEYEGRRDLGNVEPGDGPRFKGRGLFQLTGRANYKAYGDAIGIDLVTDPQRAADPATSVTLACEYWKRHNLNVQADNDDIVRITQIVNGGLNGLPDRRVYLVKAKAALARMAGAAVSAANPAAPPALRRGSAGEAVSDLQTKLRIAGYPVGVDGSFGAATELAVMHFQAANKLTVDGIAGPATLAALAQKSG
jgi:putative chitinase